MSDLLIFARHSAEARLAECLIQVEMDRAGDVAKAPVAVATHIDERHAAVEQHLRGGGVDGRRPRDLGRRDFLFLSALRHAGQAKALAQPLTIRLLLERPQIHVVEGI